MTFEEEIELLEGELFDLKYAGANCQTVKQLRQLVQNCEKLMGKLKSVCVTKNRLSEEHLCGVKVRIYQVKQKAQNLILCYEEKISLDTDF